MRALGLRPSIVAALLGVGTATVQRWRATLASGGAPSGAPRTTRRPTPLTPEQVAQVERLVRDTHGLMGADALRHSVPGVSRREAARIKRSTRTTMERERIATTPRVTVREPGLVRGFDAMHLLTSDGKRVLLVAADAAVPQRTTIEVVEHYDEASVAAALEHDFATHGAPLVLRMDRAAVHGAPAVRDVLARHGVEVLQGPPRHPRYYGQLERQNREHRAWLAPLERLPADQVPAAVTRMTEVLNEVLPRRSLGWGTAASAWATRATVDDATRGAFRGDVEIRRARLQRAADRGKMNDQLVQRLAVEQALQARGLIAFTKGGCAR